jgi:RimJ/RimL family protein N-acetyltransferase
LAEQGRQTLHDGSRACWRGGTLIPRRQPVSAFDDGTTIVTERLSLVPLRVEDAEEMTGVLGDQRLHQFIGGEPCTITGLRERYARLVAGSPDRDQLWLNWVVRRRSDAQPMGTMQATVTMGAGESTANVAWVIGVDWQNQGFASEAAQALVGWLRQHGADNVVAHIHPDHQASAAVAMRAGLRLTDEQADGERVWRAPDSGA